MKRRERSSATDDQGEHATTNDVGRKKQVQVRRTRWRHNVTSVDANSYDHNGTFHNGTPTALAECATSINETLRYAISIIRIFMCIAQHGWATSDTFFCVSFVLLSICISRGSASSIVGVPTERRSRFVAAVHPTHVVLLERSSRILR